MAPDDGAVGGGTPDLNGENRDLWAGELLMLPFGEDDIPPVLLAGVKGELACGKGVDGGAAPPPPPTR